MQGPLRSPHPSNILPARNLASIDIPANRVVALAANDGTGATLETPVTTLYEAPSNHKNAYAVTQSRIKQGQIGDVYRAGELTLESDGTAAFAVDDVVIAVVGGSAAVSGRVTKLPSPVVLGTRYEVIGKCLAPVAAIPGLLVRVQVDLAVVIGAVP
jgi:hypothetical protein